MPKLPDLVNGFKMLKEVDLNRVRLKSETPLPVMVVGEKGVGKTALIEQLLDGPRAEEPEGATDITMHRPEPDLQVPDGAAVILLLDARKSDRQREHVVFDGLMARKIPTVVCFNKLDLAGEEVMKLNRSAWPGGEMAVITALDRDTLMRELAPAMICTFKGNEAQLARHVPLMRSPVSQELIDDTCMINATYSLTTGLAEIVPVLSLPLNVADLVVLTKNQALMAYTITLAMGMKAEWHDTIPKLTAVVGSAFIWRQLARYLVGLVPVIGIVPKIAIAYAGTYVIGQAVYQWCLNGEKLNPDELKGFYVEALERGGEVAAALTAKSGVAQVQISHKFREIAQSVSEKSAITQEQANNQLRSVAFFLTSKLKATQQNIAASASKFFNKK